MFGFRKKKGLEPKAPENEGIQPTPEPAEQNAECAPIAEVEDVAKQGFFSRFKSGKRPSEEVSKAPASSAVDKQTLTSGASLLSAPVQSNALEKAPGKDGFMSRVRRGLSKTRDSFTGGMATIFLGAKTIDDDLFEAIETQMLLADIGMETTQKVINRLFKRVSRRELKRPEALFDALKEELARLLEPCVKPLNPTHAGGPYVILMVGMNGAGKTTTIGKLAGRLKKEGKSLILAAGDTFRAAAVEQLQEWGRRNDVPVVAQSTGADSASVIYDAIERAKANHVDVVIADTAGRLHTKSHLMEELKKIKRVIAKLDKSAPHEVQLVLDATIGQNAVVQAREFHQAMGVTGITITKLDGTAKGGVIFSIADHFNLPIRFIGVGESVDDLRPFDARAFAKALFEDGSKDQ